MPKSYGFKLKDARAAVELLAQHNIPPAPDGHYYMAAHRSHLEAAIVHEVMHLSPARRRILESALRVLTRVGCSDEDKFECIEHVLKAPRDKEAAGALTFAMNKATAKKSASVTTLDEFMGMKPFSRTQAAIIEVCDGLREMLLAKNRKYGDSAINPKRIFSKADPVEQIKVRLDDKLSRIESGQLDEDEDVVTDLLGYLVLLKVAQRLLDRSKNGGG